MGNSFDISFSDETGESSSSVPEGDIVLIGGGIGIFPLLYLSKSLPKKPKILLGFRDAESMALVREFSKSCEDVFIASDDGSVGHKGFVTDLLKNSIESGNKIERIYTCGPKPMMKIVAETAVSNGIDCQVSMEERMGCGVGACVTCTCTLKDGSRKRVCKDGPIFNASEVDFDG